MKTRLQNSSMGTANEKWVVRKPQLPRLRENTLAGTVLYVRDRKTVMAFDLK